MGSPCDSGDASDIDYKDCEGWCDADFADAARPMLKIPGRAGGATFVFGVEGQGRPANFSLVARSGRAVPAMHQPRRLNKTALHGRRRGCAAAAAAAAAALTCSISRASMPGYSIIPGEGCTIIATSTPEAHHGWRRAAA